LRLQQSGPKSEAYYFQIMLPGSIVGLIVGFATQKYGRPAQTAQRHPLRWVAVCSIILTDPEAAQ
jgi:multisubunit Na+/H+ antiporter MnhE subunit